jgi:hypothetical protein
MCTVFINQAMHCNKVGSFPLTWLYLVVPVRDCQHCGLPANLPTTLGPHSGMRMPSKVIYCIVLLTMAQYNINCCYKEQTLIY